MAKPSLKQLETSFRTAMEEVYPLLPRGALKDVLYAKPFGHGTDLVRFKFKHTNHSCWLPEDPPHPGLEITMLRTEAAEKPVLLWLARILARRMYLHSGMDLTPPIALTVHWAQYGEDRCHYVWSRAGIAVHMPHEKNYLGWCP